MLPAGGTAQSFWTAFLYGCREVHVNAISYTEARERLAGIWDEALSTREPVLISRRGKESVVLIARDEWEGLQETAHLLRSPANARRLLSALQRLGEGEGQTLDPAQLAARTGLG